jgi:hypothetical protein
MPDVRVNGYPTWPFLAVAAASVVAAILLLMRLDRGANPRSVYVKLLLAWLSVVGVCALGLVVDRGGRRVITNVGLLFFTDIMVTMIVAAIPFWLKTRRWSVSELRKIRFPTGLGYVFGTGGGIAFVVLVIGTLVALLAGEFALADLLPGPPAVVACQDYTAWSTYQATGAGPPPRPGILTQAAEIAPDGVLRDSLDALVADQHAADTDPGQSLLQAVATANVYSDETTLDSACRSVLAG